MSWWSNSNSSPFLLCNRRRGCERAATALRKMERKCFASTISPEASWTSDNSDSKDSTYKARWESSSFLQIWMAFCRRHTAFWGLADKATHSASTVAGMKSSRRAHGSSRHGGLFCQINFSPDNKQGQRLVVLASNCCRYNRSSSIANRWLWTLASHFSEATQAAMCVAYRCKQPLVSSWCKARE